MSDTPSQAKFEQAKADSAHDLAVAHLKSFQNLSAEEYAEMNSFLILLIEAMQRLESISSRSIMFTSTELELRIRRKLEEFCPKENIPAKIEY